MFTKAKSFLTEDIWRLRREELPKAKSIGLRALRTLLYALKGFHDDRCNLSAAALTFLTLFSIVPVFAMAFGIAKGFGVDELLKEQLRTQLQGQEEVLAKIIEFSDKMLVTTSGGLVAGIGIIILFFTVIRLLGNIEVSLNGIWGVIEHRSWVRKFSDYLAIMVVCPILLIVASSMNVYIVSQVKDITESIEILGLLSPLIFFSLKILPFVVLWLLFSFIYIVIPNTRVNITSGCIGGIVGGTIYQLFQGLYINMQVALASYGAIYGSFAALPLFLLWLQISWFIMLFGAEISFAFQNADTYELEPDSQHASELFKKLTALRLTNIVIKAFINGDAPISEQNILKEIEIPIRLTKELLHRLVDCHILAEVKSDTSRVLSYLPGRDTNILTVGYVIHALENNGNLNIPIKESSEILTLKESLESFKDSLNQKPLNTLLKDI